MLDDDPLRGVTYTVVLDNQPPHSCGLNINTVYADLPVGSVIACNICGRRWKKRMRDDHWNAAPWTTWTWERRGERRRRVRHHA